MSTIELGRPLPDLTVRIAVGALNTYEIELGDLDGQPLDLTGVTLALEIGDTTFTPTAVVANVVTFTVPTLAAVKALIGRNARLVLITADDERQIIAIGRSVKA